MFRYFLLLLLILPIHTFAVYTCGQGCVYQGNQLFHCENSAAAWQGCGGYAAGRTDGGICMQWGVGVKYSKALYVWAYPDPPLDCDDPIPDCTDKQGESYGGTYQYSAGSSLCTIPEGCELSCTNETDLGNGYNIVSGCTYTGGAIPDNSSAAEVCSLEQASSASPQDCDSGKVTNLEWNNAYQRCVKACTPDMFDISTYQISAECIKDQTEYWYDECAEEALGGLQYGGTMGGFVGMALGPVGSMVGATIGGGLGAVLSSIVCMTNDPTPQTNCDTTYFLRTASDCVPKNNPTLDPNIYRDPITGQGLRCPAGMIEDKVLGICAVADYPMPTAQQMQDALEQGITNPPRSEPCPVNTHEINGVCFKDSDNTPYKDDSTLPQDEPATQGGDGYHVWVDNQPALESLISQLLTSLKSVEQNGLSDSFMFSQQLSKLSSINDKLDNLTNTCGGAGQPSCSFDTTELQQSVDAVKDKLSDLQSMFSEYSDKDCTQQPWLMSGVFGGTLGFYECNVYDEGANEKLADIKNIVDSMAKCTEDDPCYQVDKSTKTYMDTLKAQKDEWDSAIDKEAERRARVNETLERLGIDTFDSDFTFTDYDDNGTAKSVIVPFNSWYTAILGIFPIAPLLIMSSDSCQIPHYQLSIDIQGKSMLNEALLEDFCEYLERPKVIVGWVFSILTLYVVSILAMRLQPYVQI